MSACTANRPSCILHEVPRLLAVEYQQLPTKLAMHELICSDLLPLLTASMVRLSSTLLSLLLIHAPEMVLSHMARVNHLLIGNAVIVMSLNMVVCVTVQVVFVATANLLQHMSGPLLDRLEIIQLSGYTLDEKRHIARVLCCWLS